MDNSARPNRAQRRALDKRKTKFAPEDCPQCQAYLEAHPGIRDACAEVGVEAGILPEQALMLFLNGFHDNDHSETVTEEAAGEAETPEAKATRN